MPLVSNVRYQVDDVAVGSRFVSRPGGTRPTESRIGGPYPGPTEVGKPTSPQLRDD